jgi:DNA-binding FadR family transcriptional regulator
VRRTDEQLAVIEAHQRRIAAAAAEPLARRAADLDFHAAVIDAAQNSLLAHVGAMIRVALDSAAPPDTGRSDNEAGALRAAVIEAIRTGDGEAAEKAMRMLVDLAWEAINSERREEIR